VNKKRTIVIYLIVLKIFTFIFCNINNDPIGVETYVIIIAIILFIILCSLLFILLALCPHLILLICFILKALLFFNLKDILKLSSILLIWV